MNDDDAYLDYIAYWEYTWNKQAEEAHFWDEFWNAELWDAWRAEVEREQDDDVSWWRL